MPGAERHLGDNIVWATASPITARYATSSGVNIVGRHIVWGDNKLGDNIVWVRTHLGREHRWGGPFWAKHSGVSTSSGVVDLSVSESRIGGKRPQSIYRTVGLCLRVFHATGYDDHLLRTRRKICGTERFKRRRRTFSVRVSAEARPPFTAEWAARSAAVVQRPNEKQHERDVDDERSIE